MHDPLLREQLLAGLKGELTKANTKSFGQKRNGRPKLITKILETRIVGMRGRGQSYQAIAGKLTADRVPTPTGLDVWSWTTVSRVVNRQ